jgi:hypothetical protein
MAPRSASKGVAVDGQTYHAGTASVQGFFPERRKSVRRRPATIPRPTRQETLTQLSFTRLISPDKDEYEYEYDDQDGILAVGDSQEEEDSDEELMRPKKKRKSTSTPTLPPTAKRTKRKHKLASTAFENQRTMTQMLPRLPIPIHSDDEEIHAGIELSSQDYKDLSEEEETIKFSRMDDWIATQSQHDGRPVAPQDDLTRVLPPLSIESSEFAIPSSPARPVLASINDPRTPKRVRVLEIPSSQSPAATPISSRLSPSKRRKRVQENSPLRDRLTSIQMVQSSPSKLKLARSPLKESSANTLKTQISPQELAPCEKAVDGQADRTSPQKLAPHKKTADIRSGRRSPQKALANQPAVVQNSFDKDVGHEAANHDAPPDAQTIIDSPTRQRVALFNARYAALSRQSSSISGKRRTGPFERNQIIRSSTGWSSREDEEVATPRTERPQQVETQFPIGDETQDILGAIDLASNAVNVQRQLDNPLSQNQHSEITCHTDEEERVPSSQDDGQEADVSVAAEGKVLQGSEKQALSSQNWEEKPEPKRKEDCCQETFVHEQRVPSFHPKRRVVEDSQDPEASSDLLDEDMWPERSQVAFEDGFLPHYVEGTQWLPPVDSLRDTYYSQDPASEQLLRETQAYAKCMPSSPMFSASSPIDTRLSPQTPSSSRHSRPTNVAKQIQSPTTHPSSTRPTDHSRPSQATTVDETQIHSTLRTQRHLPSSPIRPTQTILVPSSPVPVPPLFSSSHTSKSSGVQTPTTLRYVKMAPLTISQLIPESLRIEGSLAIPPMWTQDFDEEDDEL